MINKIPKIFSYDYSDLGVTDLIIMQEDYQKNLADFKCMVENGVKVGIMFFEEFGKFAARFSVYEVE